jgi:hypothetical protein
LQAATLALLALSLTGSGAQAAPPLTHPAATAPSKKVDSTALGSAPTPVPSATPGPIKGDTKGRSKLIANDESSLDAKTEKDLLKTLDSLNTLLSISKPGPARDKILLNRAIAANRYGRQKLISEKQYALTDEVKKYLNFSIADANELIKNPKTPKDILLRAHDIAGVSALYLEENDLAKAHFLEELKLNPPSAKAGRIGLLLAEQAFDKNNFQEAAQFYTHYFPDMISKWKELSLYKLGWCAVNLNHPDQAKEYFLKIAHSNSATGIGRDAIRDLAYFSSAKAGCFPEIVATQARMPKLEDQRVFLNDALLNLEALNFPVEHGQVAERLLGIDKDPVDRAGILLSQVRMQRRVFANTEHLQAYTLLIESIEKLSSAHRAEVLEKYGAAIELESENIFKAYVDTAVGKVRDLEPHPQTAFQLVEAMKFELNVFKKYFQTNVHFPVVVELWENFCLDNKDWQEIDNITDFIIKDQPRLNSLLENAYLNQIAALDQLKNDPEKRTLRLKEYVEKFPNSPHWSQVAKWYAQIEMDGDHFDIALKIWSKLMQVEPSANNFYQLQYCRFKLSDFNGVLSDDRNKTYALPQTETLNLYRESSLQVAEKAKQTNDLSAYRNHVEEFIRLSTDPEKARIARVDYFNFLLSKGLLDEAEGRYVALTPDEKKSKIYDEFRQNLWRLAIEKQQYELAIKAAPTPQQLEFSTLLAGHALEAKTIDALTDNDRNYFLGLAALFNPDFAIPYLSHDRQKLTTRDLLILSYRVKLNQWRLERTPELEKVFGKNYAFVDSHAEELPVDQEINSVKFPNLAKYSAKTQGRLVENNLYLVRRTSQRAMKAIVGKSTETQLSVFQKMQALETSMANFLLSSPIPAGLNSDQLAQYNEGLKNAADEFVQQAQQFKLLVDKTQGELEKSKLSLAAKTLPEPDMTKWSWPDVATKDPRLTPVFTLAKAGNVIGALALLDYLRPTVFTSDEIFFWIRTGTILKSNPNDSVRIYLLEELQKNKQSKIIQQWALLTGRPVPEAP